MIVHLPTITFDIVVFRTPPRDFEFLARHDYVGGVGASGPFLAVGAVAECGDHGGAAVGVVDGAAEAGSCCHSF